MKVRIPIKGGRLACNQAITRMNKYFAKCNDGEYTMEIKPMATIRSLEQNKLYWDILNQASEQTGMTAYEIHETMRATYLQRAAANGLIKISSTTELSTAEFVHYINQVVAHLSHFAVITMPEDRHLQQGA